MKNYFLKFANYNRWANKLLYQSCKAISTSEYHLDRKAFFKSIHGTLNHILVVDRLWFDRAKGIATGAVKLDEILFGDLDTLITQREKEDELIISYIATIEDASLDNIISYKTTEGIPNSKALHLILAHVFNHQTHHRGQVHNMLTQAGVEAPAIDFMYYLPEYTD